MQGFGGNPWRYPDDCLTCFYSWPWFFYELYPPAPGRVPYTPLAACPTLRPGISCGDRNTTHCPFWASQGLCTNPDDQQYMSVNCMVRPCGLDGRAAWLLPARRSLAGAAVTWARKRAMR